MKLQKHIREVVAVLREEGLTVLACRQGGKHMRIETSAGLFVCPVSPGDVRGLANTRAWARRQARASG